MSILSGDVNGDGKADVIAVNGSTTYVMTSNGISSFNPPQLWSNVAFSGGISTLVGDVNGDGKADLIAVNSTSVWVMTANSAGTAFNSPQKWSSATFSGSVATLVGDVNGDRKADMIAVNSVGTYVMTSNGTTGFNAPHSWSSAAFYGNVATLVGDASGDGSADLIAVNSASVWVMTSNGSTGFGPSTQWSSTGIAGTRATLAGDANGDGKTDLIAVNYTSSTNTGYTRVMTANSAGTSFNQATQWSGAAFNGTAAVLTGDVDASGTADLIAVDYGSYNATWVMLAAGVPAAPTNVKASAADARAIVTWSAAASAGNALTKYTVTPYVGQTAQTALAVTITATYGSSIATTANVGGLTDGTVYTFQVTATNGIGTGPPGSSGPVTPAPPAPVVIAPGSGYNSNSTPQNVVLGDLAGNGWPDILTGNGSGNSLSTLLNQVKGNGHAGGTFSQPATMSPASAGASKVALGDFNGDGKVDAAIVSGTSTVYMMLGNGDGTFGPETAVATLTNQTANYVAVADVNGDGKQDIVVAGNIGPFPYGTAFDVLLGVGSGTFQAPVQYPVGDVCLGCGFQSSGLALADVNGDGLPDVLYTNDSTGSSDSGTVYAFTNQGGGIFRTPAAWSAGMPGPKSGSGNTVAVADLNGDGKPDLIVNQDAVYIGLNGSGGQRGVSIFFGKGDGTFQAGVYVCDPALFTPNSNCAPSADAGDPTGVAIADMNGDGIPDIVTADASSNSGQGGISVYLNPGGGNINAPTFIATPGFSSGGIALADVNGDKQTDVVLENGQPVGPGVPANVLVLLNGTDFPPLGGPLGPNEMHGCAMCQAMRGGGALSISGNQPITVNSGEMSHTFTDLAIPARGYPLGVTQTYNDLVAATDAGLGYGWWSPLFMSVTQNSTTGVTSVTQEDGAQAQFWTNSLQPVAPRTQATLAHNGDGTWTFTRYKGDTFSFSASGQITSIANLDGDGLTFGYTGSQVTSVTHSDGRSLTVAWSNGHVSSITDANVSGATRKVAFAYDGSSQLTDIDWTVNGGSDRNEHFEYASTPWAHGMTGMRDPRGIWVTQVYDSSGHTTAQTIDPTSKDPTGLNRTTTYSYTLSGGAISQVLVTDPAGHEEQDTFAYGELVQKVRGFSTASAATGRYAYDPSSVGTRTVIDPNGHTSTASYDTLGNPLATVDALGRVAYDTYAGNGGGDAQHNQPTTVTDPNGVTTTYSYDSTHRTLTQTSTPLVGSSPAVNQVTQYQHTTSGHPGDVTGVVDGDGKTWLTGYNAVGDKTSATDPLGDKSTTTYNADGWVLTTITPKGDPSVCTSPCTPAQYTTSYAFVDGSGNPNFWGLPTTVTDPLGHIVTTVHDANNNITQVTDGNGNLTTSDFDNANELTVTHRPDAGHTTTKTDYNADGTVADQVDGKGNTLQSYTYNS
ncbi:MAG: FG-GAP-like repeat-containing protein, partial [Candidatus Dormibacter sp.]